MKQVFPFSPCLFLFLFLFISACHFDLEDMDLTDNQPKSDCLRFNSATDLEICWQKPLWSDTAESEAVPIVLDDKVLLAFTGRDFGKLKMLDAFDGHTLWQGNDPSDGSIACLGASVLRYEHFLVLTDRKKIILLDLNTGQRSTLLEAPPHSSIQREMNVWGNQLFYSINACDSSLNYSTLLRASMTDLVEQKEYMGDTLFVSAIGSSSSPWQSHPQFGTDLNGDTLMAFLNYRYWGSDLHLDLVVCNLSTSEVLYERPDVEINEGINGHGDIIDHKNKIYLSTAQACRCFDMITGHLLWEDAPSGSCFPDGTAPVEAIWEVCGGARYLLIDHKITAVNLGTSETLWSEPTPNYTTCTLAGYPDNPPRFSGGVAAHVGQHSLIATDGYFAMCIKLPER